MSGKVCEARTAAFDRLPHDVLCNIIDGRGTEPLPDMPALLIHCPPLDAPHPGCGADAGEACREPLAPVRSVVRIDVDRFADAVRDATRRHPSCECDGSGCGWCSPSDNEPAVDVGELRAEIERLHGVVHALRLTAIQRVPAWQCSGCSFVLRAWQVRDGTCPSCRRVGYLSGSVRSAAIVAHDAAALAAMGAP